VPKLSDADRETRRRRVLDGARRCFARHGYEGATVVRLEEEIGLSRGAIFNWFGSKQELFLALAAEDNARLHALFATDGVEALLDAVLHDDADWLAVYHEFGRRLRTDAELLERWLAISPEGARERTLAWIADGQSRGQLRDDVEPEEIGRFIGVIIDGVAVQRAFGLEPPEQELLVRLLGDAIGARPGGEVSD
jgi:TetR/AcrR family transcriptional regulator, transcriptional repressor of aconitase